MMCIKFLFSVSTYLLLSIGLSAQCPEQVFSKSNGKCLRLEYGSTVPNPDGNAITVELINSTTYTYVSGNGGGNYIFVDGNANPNCNNGGKSFTGTLMINEETCDYISGALPITLVYFKGEKSTQGYHLQWQTAHEHNNEYFLVERSADAVHFETIGQVNGVGNSSEIQTYNYIDLSPQIGLNYYRLTQYDVDGQSSSSNVIVYEHLHPGDTEVSVYNRQLKIYSTVDIKAVALFSINGRFIQSFHSPERPREFNLRNIDPGNYILRIITRDQTIGKKIQIR